MNGSVRARGIAEGLIPVSLPLGNWPLCGSIQPDCPLTPDQDEYNYTAKFFVHPTYLSVSLLFSAIFCHAVVFGLVGVEHGHIMQLSREGGEICPAICMINIIFSFHSFWYKTGSRMLCLPIGTHLRNFILNIMMIYVRCINNKYLPQVTSV